MSRSLATLLSLAFIGWLWYRDSRNRPNLSKALWIPTLVLLVLSSRPLSFWCGFSGGSGSLEGNGFDRNIILVEILVCAYILSKRGVRWGEVIRNNRGLFLFYGFLLATVIWAEYPFVTFKRWFKEVGTIAVILVVLTDQDPFAAIEAVFLRCSYVLLPLSVVFIKYIPELGRSYGYGGEPTYCGVAEQKNSLGEIVLVFGLVIMWRVLAVRDATQKWLSKSTMVFWLMLGIGAYLLMISDSKTALLCLMAGCVILMSYKLPIFKTNPKYVLICFLLIVPVFFTANKLFNLSDELLRLIGRNPTLTNRTEIWDAIRQHPVNSTFGCGYLMYWDIVGKIYVDGSFVELKTAHNGYLDIYLDGGWIGIGFLAAMLIALGARVSRALMSGTPYGRLQFAFFVVVLVYNISESAYALRSPLWFSFLLFTLWPPRAFSKILVPQSEAQTGHAQPLPA